jgi:hypothetical protein
MSYMRKILFFLFFFTLGVLSVLRCQYYNKEADLDSSFSEKLKNVMDGVIDDCVCIKDYIQSKVSSQELASDTASASDVKVEMIEVDEEASQMLGMNADNL